MAAAHRGAGGGSSSWEGWAWPCRPAATIPGTGAGFAGRSSGGSEVGRGLGRSI